MKGNAIVRPGRIRNHTGPDRNYASSYVSLPPYRINDELECLHIPNGEVQAMAQKACQIYLQIYGKGRNAKKRGMRRCDIGSSKRRTSDDTAPHTLQVRNVDSAQHVFRQSQSLNLSTSTKSSNTNQSRHVRLV